MWRWTESNQGGPGSLFEREASITIGRGNYYLEAMSINWRGYNWRVVRHENLVIPPFRLVVCLQLVCLYGDKK